MSNFVFCPNCRYFKHRFIFPDECKKRVMWESTFSYDKIRYNKRCRSINRDNECKGFSQKLNKFDEVK